MDRVPFITGSYAYGTPRKPIPTGFKSNLIYKPSDVDVVVFAYGAFIGQLNGLSLADKQRSFGHHGSSYIFGSINLIFVTTETDFDLWKQGTEHLKTIAPVTRQQAVDYLVSIGLKDQGSC